MDSLTKEELEILNAIMNISYSLIDNLNKLRNLELTGNYDEIKKKINLIKQTLMLEYSLYEKIPKNRIGKIIGVINPNSEYKVKDDFNLLINKNNDELVKKRIIIKLNDRTDTIDVLTTLFGEEVKYPTILRNSVNKDIINTLMKLLSDTINNSKYKNILESLYYLKYNIAFLYDFVLEDLLENNFIINNSLYWESNMTLTLYNLPKYLLDAFKMEISFDILSDAIDRLGKMSRTSLKDINNYAKSIIDQMLIRTSLLFLQENEVLEVRKVVENSIKTGELLNGEADAEKMILDCFDSYKKDIELPMVINLKI